MGVSLTRHIALWWFVLPLRRSGVLSASVVKLVEFLFRRWFGSEFFNLRKASTMAVSSPGRWSNWTLTRRLPDRRIQCQAGSGDGTAAVARLRLVLEIEFVWLSEDLVVFSLFSVMFCIVRSLLI